MKFAVTSYFPDEQQIFTDFVEAADADAAKQIVGDAREYAVPADAVSLNELRDLAAGLEAETDTPASAFALAATIGDETALLSIGTAEQLNAWVQAADDFTSSVRRQLVDEELGGRIK